MSVYCPVFTIEQRKEPALSHSLGVWVTMPNGEKWNLGDILPTDLDERTIELMVLSFERGFKAAMMLVETATNTFLSTPGRADIAEAVHTILESEKNLKRRKVKK